MRYVFERVPLLRRFWLYGILYKLSNSKYLNITPLPKLLIISSFFFYHNVLKILLPQMYQKAYVCWYGLFIDHIIMSSSYIWIKGFSWSKCEEAQIIHDFVGFCTFDIIIYARYREHMSRSMRKPTLWSLRYVSTQISMRSQRRLIQADSYRLNWDRGIELWFMKQKIYRRRSLYVRVSLRGILRLIRFDALRRVHTVGFLVGRLI